MKLTMDKGMQNSVEHVATAVSYGVSGTAVFLGLNVDQWGIVAAVAGVIGIVITFAFNAWFKFKYHRGD